MSAPITVTLPVEIPLTVETLADAFSQLTDDEQAKFFVKVAERFMKFTGPLSQAFEIGVHLRTCECSTEAAREWLREVVDAIDQGRSRDDDVKGKPPARVCEICRDTHRMTLGDREVPCTHCPTPCQACRAGGNGAYCATTPCACDCHVKGVVVTQPTRAEIVEDIRRARLQLHADDPERATRMIDALAARLGLL